MLNTRYGLIAASIVSLFALSMHPTPGAAAAITESTTPGAPTAQAIARKYTAMVGTPDNAARLVAGLHAGTPVAFESRGRASVHLHFNSQPLGYPQVDAVLSRARSTLEEQHVTWPATPYQIGAAVRSALATLAAPVTAAAAGSSSAPANSRNAAGASSGGTPTVAGISTGTGNSTGTRNSHGIDNAGSAGGAQHGSEGTPSEGGSGHPADPPRHTARFGTSETQVKCPAPCKESNFNSGGTGTSPSGTGNKDVAQKPSKDLGIDTAKMAAGRNGGDIAPAAARSPLDPALTARTMQSPAYSVKSVQEVVGANKAMQGAVAATRATQEAAAAVKASQEAATGARVAQDAVAAVKASQDAVAAVKASQDAAAAAKVTQDAAAAVRAAQDATFSFKAVQDASIASRTTFDALAASRAARDAMDAARLVQQRQRVNP